MHKDTVKESIVEATEVLYKKQISTIHRFCISFKERMEGIETKPHDSLSDWIFNWNMVGMNGHTDIHTNTNQESIDFSIKWTIDTVCLIFVHL